MVLLATGLSAVAQSVTWKWRDKSGQIHISDMPPPADVPEKSILQRPTTARSYVAPPAAAKGPEYRGRTRYCASYGFSLRIQMLR